MEPPDYSTLKAKVRKATRPLLADFPLMIGVTASIAAGLLLGGFLDGARAGSVWQLGGEAMLLPLAGMILSITGFGAYQVLAGVNRKAQNRKTGPKHRPGSSNVRAAITDIAEG